MTFTARSGTTHGGNDETEEMTLPAATSVPRGIERGSEADDEVATSQHLWIVRHLCEFERLRAAQRCEVFFTGQSPFGFPSPGQRPGEQTHHRPLGPTARQFAVQTAQASTNGRAVGPLHFFCVYPARLRWAM